MPRLFLLLLAAPLLSAYTGKNVNIDGATVAKEANRLIGRPYVYGGNSPVKGIDCSALVKYIYGKYGFKIPRKASWQIENTKGCPTYTKLSMARIGDALYFRSAKTGKIHHVAIVTGFNARGVPIITHAKGKNFGVVRETMDRRYMREFAGFKRFHLCTSPLAGVYTNKEIANAVILVAGENGMDPKRLGRFLERLGGLEPLGISVPLTGDRRLPRLIRLLEKAGIPSEINRDRKEVVFYPKDIKEAKALSLAFRSREIRHYSGLARVPSDYFGDSEHSRIFYPIPNLSRAAGKIRECIRRIDSLDGEVACYLEKTRGAGPRLPESPEKH